MAGFYCCLGLISLLFHVISCESLEEISSEPQWINNLQQELAVLGVLEDTPIGSTVGRLSAWDPAGRDITYFSESKAFSVQPDTGYVTLTRSLDREVQSSVRVNFAAKNSAGGRTTITYSVHIRDANDNAPQFTELPYAAIVPVPAAPGSIVYSGIIVKDNDQGENSRISLSCAVSENQMANTCEKFTVTQRRLADGIYQGIVTVRAPLNLLGTTSFNISIQARDHGDVSQVSVATVQIQLSPGQPPQLVFENTPISFAVYEGLLVGTMVGEIMVRGEENSAPIYMEIFDDPAGAFELHGDMLAGQQSLNAKIVATEHLDREFLGSDYYIIVKAYQDRADGRVEAETLVTVDVLDLNDNKPTFNQQTYVIDVPENLPAGTLIPDLDIVVSDPDLGINGEYELQLLNLNEGSFKLVPSSGKGDTRVFLEVNDASYLDYENENYRVQVLEIVAKESKSQERLSSSATVTINLYDLNDHNPEFLETNLVININQKTDLDRVVGRVAASDADSGANADLSFGISGPGSEMFDLNKKTGELTLRDAAGMQGRLAMQVDVTDGGGRTAETQANVTIITRNDLAPIFLDFDRNTEVEEGSIRFNPEITVRARDPEGTMVYYSIVSGDSGGVFTIHPTLGTIQLIHPISYQATPLGQGRFDLTISATDSGVPRRTNTTVVTVRVLDRNDNRPVFLSPHYSANISELAQPGTAVLTVTATDNDAGRNREIRYELQGANTFTINPTSGLISLADNINIDLNGNSYQMTAYAKDQGTPQQTGSTMVSVYVTDANNHNPVFTQNVYRAALSEGSSIGTTVARVQAVDPDSNSNIIYTIQSTDPTNYQVAFTINKNSGDITTQRIVQRENVGEVILVVKAEDTNADIPRPQTATATVRIQLETTANEVVSFSPPWTRLNPYISSEISEDTPVGSAVFTLRATDASSNGRAIQDFTKEPNSDIGDYFSVAQTTGVVTLSQALDYEKMRMKQIQFQVIARTASFPYKSAVATVVFNVKDVNDNSPIFLQQSYTFTTPESTRFPQEIGTITAKDPDSGEFGQVQYTLSGAGSEKFYLDKISGRLVVASNEMLDAEKQRVYDLMVTASDAKSNGHSATANVRINVEDVNDNAPTFTSAIYTAYYREENIPAGVSLAQVTAQDPDITYGTVTYSISSGNQMGLFMVDQVTGTIRASRDLTSYARGDPYRITVKAWDNGPSPLSGEARVDIYLIIATNNTNTGLAFIVPTRDGFVQEIREGQPERTEVMTVTARDNNPDARGAILYSLFTPSDTFMLNSTTGVLYTRVVLDREQQDTYQLRLVARSQDRPDRETYRQLVIKVLDVDDNPPRFSGCSAGTSNNQNEVNIAGMQQGQHILLAKACDLDIAPNNIIRYSIICGNSPRDVTNGNRPFRIDINSGDIISEISMKDKYTFRICVKASNDADNIVPEEVDFFADSVRNNPSILRVIVNIGGGLDIPDGVLPPNFPNNNATYVTSILSNAEFHSEVIQILASSASGARLTYSLQNIRFNGQRPESNDFFVIDREDGTIYTNRQLYRNYINGHFTMEVDISNQGAVYAKAGVVTYVVPEEELLRLTFSSPVDHFLQVQKTFESDASTALKAQLVGSGVRYALKDNKVSTDRFDYCFHMREGNSVLPYERARERITINRDALNDIYQRLRLGNPEELGRCVDVNATTAWWSDHWFLWWILIAIGIALGVHIILTIIWICVCYCWSRKKLKDTRPFLLLDNLNTSRENMQWQEQTVKMS